MSPVQANNVIQVQAGLNALQQVAINLGGVQNVQQIIQQNPQIQTQLQKVEDRKSTRLNSSHSQISYAVFCLKKKNTQTDQPHLRRDNELGFHGATPTVARFVQEMDGRRESTYCPHFV